MVYFPTEQDWTLTMRPNRIPVNECFPGHFAVNSLPTANRKSTKSAAQLPAGNLSGNSAPPWAQMRQSRERQTTSTNEPVRSFMYRTGPNLVPLGQGREAGELSDHLDQELFFNHSDTSIIDKGLDAIESSPTLPGTWN